MWMIKTITIIHTLLYTYRFTHLYEVHFVNSTKNMHKKMSICISRLCLFYCSIFMQ